MQETGLLARKQQLNNVELQSILTSQLGSEARSKAIMTSMGLSVAIEGEEAQTVKLTAKKLKQAIADGILTKEEAQLLAMTTGVTIAQKTQISSVMPKWIANMKAMALATWDQVKATAAWLATTPAGWATLAIGGIVGVITAISKHNKKAEEAKQKIQELGEEARNASDEIKSNFESTKSTVDSVAKKYAELAQGVKNLGKASQSQGTLSNDEYSEFLDISNQLADLFPGLTVGYDDNGNAILNLNGNVKTITDSLNALISAEEQAASLKIADEMDDIFKDYSLKVNGDNGYSAQYNEILNQKKALDEYYTQILNTGITDGFSGLSDEALTELRTQLENFGIDIDDFYNRSIMGENFTQEEINAIKSAFIIMGEEYQNELDALSSKIDVANKEFGSYVVQSFKSNDTYKVIEEKFGANGTNLVNSILTNSGYDTLLSKTDGDWDKAVEYIEDNILDNFTNLSEDNMEEFQSVYARLLAIDPDKALAENIPLMQQYIDRLAELLNIDSKQLQIAFGLDIEEDNNLINQAKDRLGFNENANNSTDAKRNKEINDFVNSLNEEDLKLLLDAEIPDSVRKGTKEDWEKYLAELQKETDNNPLILRSELQTSATNVKSAFDDLFKAYDDYQKNGLQGMDTSNISNLNKEDTFGNINGATASYEKFLSVMQDVDATAKDVQEAFDDLASAYLYHSDLANKIKEDNAEWIASELEKNGVINASAVAEQMLINKYGMESAAISECTRANLSLNDVKLTNENASEQFLNATLEDINALVAEANAAGVDATALRNYELDKIASSDTTIKTDGDIANLMGLCNALGDAGTLMERLIELKAALSNANNSYVKDRIQAEIDKVTASMKARLAMGNKANTSSTGGYRTSSPGTGTNNTNTSPAKEATEELFDWIERRTKKYQRGVDKWLNQAESTSSKISQYYDKAESNLKKLTDTDYQAYKRYMQQADSYGLSDAYKQKVKDGLIDIESITDDALKEQIQNYQTYYDKATDSLDNYISHAEQLYNLPLDEAATKVEKYENAISSLDKKLDNAIGYNNQNKIINQQTSEQKKILTAYQNASKIANKNADSASKSLSKSSNLNASNGITASEKSAILKSIKAGKEVDLSYFTEGSQGYKEAVKYNEAIKARIQAQSDLNDATQDWNAWLVEASKTKFDNIATAYDYIIQINDEGMSKLDRKISEIEARGKKVNKQYYLDQKDINAKNKADYQEELKKLQEQLKTIKKGTDEWYDARKEIESVKDSISECTIETYNLNDAIRQLDIDLFNNVADTIGRIATEYDFITSLNAHAKNVNEETAGFNNEGFANLGSASIGYSSYSERAKRDSDEIAKLQKMLESGNYGIYNSAENLQERIDELYDTWQSDISQTYSYETKLADIMKEKYQAELDLVKELIDKKKESLNLEKDLHDYQKKLNEQTSNINTLQKQIAAYSNDTSEESMAKLHSLQKQLQDSQEELRETEYDRYISDQQDMLDKLATEYEEQITKKLDDFQSLVNEGLKLVNDNLGIINQTLKDTASKYGYDTQYNGVTNPSGNVSDNVSNVVGKEEETLAIQSGTKTPLEYIENNASKATKKKSEYSDVNKAIYDMTGGKVLSATELKELSALLGIKYNNGKETGNLYKKLVEIGLFGKFNETMLKSSKFKTGGIAQVAKSQGEDGWVLARNGEGFIAPENVEQIQKLLDTVPLINTFTDSIQAGIPKPIITDIAKNIGNTTSIGDVQFNFELPNVKDSASLLNELKNNNEVQKTIQKIVINPLAGKSLYSVKH